MEKLITTTGVGNKKIGQTIIIIITKRACYRGSGFGYNQPCINFSKCTIAVVFIKEPLSLEINSIQINKTIIVIVNPTGAVSIPAIVYN
jgi:hypothetical protein